MGRGKLDPAIDTEDIAVSIHEIDGGSDVLVYADEEPSPTSCPRGRRPMSSCTLRLGALELDGTYLCCDRDGIWFTREAMTAVFARVSRRGGFRGLGAVGGGQRGGRADRDGSTSHSAMIGNMSSGHGGIS